MHFSELLYAELFFADLVTSEREGGHGGETVEGDAVVDGGFDEGVEFLGGGGEGFGGVGAVGVGDALSGGAVG